MGTITRDTLNRLMDLRDAARDGYYDANFGALRVCEAEPSVVVVAQIAVRAEAAPAGVTA